ncbi:hypothetical protein ABEF95_013521 [Exophiala dermatitidis]
MPVCKFFRQGHCYNGSKCEFEHIAGAWDVSRETPPEARSTELETPSLTQSPLPLPAHPHLIHPELPGDFFCRAVNTPQSSTEATIIMNSADQSTDLQAQNMTNTAPTPLSIPQIQRQIDGILVIFGSAAEVLNLEFPDSVTRPTSIMPGCTVICNWFKRSGVAYLQYRNKRSVGLAWKTLHRDLHGRRLNCRLLPPVQNVTSQDWIQTIEVGNLSPKTGEKDLQDILRGFAPDNFAFSRAPRQSTIQHNWTLSFLASRFSAHGGKLASLELVPTGKSHRWRAHARFQTSTDTDLALSVSGRYLPELRSRLFMEQVVTVEIPTLPEVYFALSDQILNKWRQSHKTIHNWVRYEKADKAVLVITGKHPYAVSELRVAIEQILAGRIIFADTKGKPLWHDFFLTDAGLSFLNSLSQPRLLFVHRDLRTHQLIMHGPASLYEHTQNTIIAMLSQGQCAHSVNTNHDDYEEVLSQSFRSFVSSRPAQLYYCPTPNCPTILPVVHVEGTGGEGLVVSCPGCHELLCSACRTTSHEGVTCAEMREIRARLTQNEDGETWSYGMFN